MNREAYTDGACRKSNPGECAAAWAYYEDGVLVAKDSWLLKGLNTNNVAEHTAVLGLLRWLHSGGERYDITGVTIHCDSRLVVEQVNRRWITREGLLLFQEQSTNLLLSGGHTLVHVKGHSGVLGNEFCDRLCNEALDQGEV